MMKLDRCHRIHFSLIGSLVFCLTCLSPYSITWAQDQPSPPLPLLAATENAAANGTLEQATVPDTEPRLGRLRFKNGDFAVGSLQASEANDRLAWKSPHFLEPFRVDLAAIQSMDIQSQLTPAQAQGDFSFELHSGERFWGNIVEWNAEKLVVQSASLGKVSLDPRMVRHLRNWGQQTQILYQGPNSMEAWTPLNETSAWSIESGSLVSHQNGSKIRGKIGLKARSQIDLRLSWTSRPGFVMAFGTNSEQTSAGAAFSLEVWDDKLALVRDSGSRTDATHLTALAPRNASIELSLFLDQVAGTAVVYSDRGKKLGSVQLPLDQEAIGDHCILENYGRDLRLDLLRVQTWENELPIEQSNDEQLIFSKSEQTFKGKITLLDDAKNLKIVDGDQEQTLALNDLRELIQNDAVAKTEESAITLALVDQTRIIGDWLACDGKNVRFQMHTALEPIEIPIRLLATMRGKTGDFVSSKPDGTREGQLILPDLILHGYLVDSSSMSTASCLHWKARQIELPVHILENAEGRIDFRRIDQRANLIRGANQNNPNQPRANPSTNSIRRTVPNISLRTGDLILAEVEKIDDQGVTFKSNSTTTTFIPHDRIQAIEMRRILKERTQAPQKMARLLTVPRMRKNDPPSHLVASKDGDYLRGRIVRMDSENLTMEVRLQEIQIPTENIAQLIWLHDRGWNQEEGQAGESAEQTAEPAPVATKEPAIAMLSESDSTRAKFQVHAVERTGWKMTFAPEKIESDILVGTSQLLGACNVPVKNIDLLLLGPAVDAQARELTSNPWKLALAKQPRINEETNEDGDDTAGTQSALVGKAAPKIEGETLDGETFQLKSLLGQVVVLDFWASWCGPCMQSMPIVDAAVAEAGEGQATLIAVNLEEPADRAQAALERLKLKTKVVLDIDGAAAKRYEANAIPQTVIIDREGIIRYVFVGGGPKFADQLKAALIKVIDDEPPQ